ncbi:MAG: SRPBCC family protein, partial [Gammaproteobacteria bacterium]
LILLLSSSVTISQAGEVISSFVDEIDDHYIIRIDMRVNAEINDVYKHLTDLKNIYKLNNTIISSVVKLSNGKQHEVEVKTSGCVLFFCTDQIQYQKVSELDNGYIMIHLVPEKSDFLSGEILWQVYAENNKTRVIFAADFEPDFWIPPLIGPWILTDVFLDESQETINELEKLAQATKLARQQITAPQSK